MSRIKYVGELTGRVVVGRRKIAPGEIITDDPDDKTAAACCDSESLRRLLIRTDFEVEGSGREETKPIPVVEPTPDTEILE